MADQPGFVTPMLASAGTLGDLRGDGWLLERKFDGFRCIAVRDGDRIELWSRNRLSFLGRFPGIAPELAALAPDRFVIDGEVVAHAGGRSTFAFIGRDTPGRSVGLVCFDLLHLLGQSTLGLPLADRRSLLERILDGGPPGLALSPTVPGTPAEALETARQGQWEGLVAKKRSSTYSPGRSRSWRKLKLVADQEFVVGGWTPSHAGRTGFRALLVGYHPEGENGGLLRFAGKVGSGFDEQELASTRARIEASEVAASPFDSVVREPGVRWTRPELVIAVTFSEWTPDDRIRHPRFSGLRPDKAAADVRRDPPVV